MNGTITDVTGIEVGQVTDLVNGTGCTVLLCRDGATGGVDVRGAAPGTRETDLLRAENSVPHLHGILLAGGSAFGLSAASGVVRYLEEQGSGHKVGGRFVVPIVPGAIIFDLGVGESAVRPTDEDGFMAASIANTRPVMQGTVGAGTGATAGKALGRERSMKGGVGSASMDLGDGLVLAALVVVNAVGSVHDPSTGGVLAGPRDADGRPLAAETVYADPAYGRGEAAPDTPAALGNTTIGVIATNAKLTKPQAGRLATVAHDGLAMAVRPSHTVHDGDTFFAAATGLVDAPDEFPRLTALTPTVVAQAIINAIWHATSLHGFPSMAEVFGDV